MITATLAPGYSWSGVALDDWVFHQFTATYTITFEPVECEEVAPIQPLVIQSACTLGAVSAPFVIPAEDSEAIVYTVSGAQVPGGTVTVTATVQGVNGYIWPTVEVPEGWTIVGDVATYTVTLDVAECGPTSLTPPAVTQASCTAGGIVMPRVDLPLDSEGIAYEKSGDEVPGGTVVVTARLKDGYNWESMTAEGWTFTSALATQTIVLDTPLCAAAIPSIVEVTQATCEFGLVNPPVILISGNTESVFYTFEGEIEPGATVVITATLEDGFEWEDTTVPGWTFTQSTATYTVVLDPSGCAPADPGLPVVTQGSCLDDVLILPAVELPADTDAVTYTRTGNDVPGGTVVVTATLNPGYTWSGAPLAGWVYTTPAASYTFQYDQVPCAQVLPVAPIVGLGSCVDGELTGSPSVELPTNTDAVTYTKAGDEVFGGSVVVTATLATGYSWASTNLAGWEFTSANSATYTVDLTPPDCEDPLTPGVSEDSPTPGVNTLPSTGAGADQQPFVIGMLAAAMVLLVLARLSMIRRTPSRTR